MEVACVKPAFKVPLALILPITSNFSPGVVVPIPILSVDASPNK